MRTDVGCHKSSLGATIRGMTKRQGDRGAHLEGLVETAKGLAHPARLRILAMLADGELCVCQVIAVLGYAPSTISQHLSVLSRGGLVAERKEGKLVFYRLRDDGAAATLLPTLLDLVAADSAVKSDRAIVARLRRVPIAILCAADLNLEAVGVHAGRTEARQASAQG